MRFAISIEAASTWRDILDECRYTESIGWDGIWFSDHFMPNTAAANGPMNEGWTMVAALAAAVPRVRIGTLVCGNTFRHPAVLAKMAAGIDQISHSSSAAAVNRRHCGSPPGMPTNGTSGAHRR